MCGGRDNVIGIIFLPFSFAAKLKHLKNQIFKKFKICYFIVIIYDSLCVFIRVIVACA